jgi:hypothetical protein
MYKSIHDIQCEIGKKIKEHIPEEKDIPRRPKY